MPAGSQVSDPAIAPTAVSAPTTAPVSLMKAEYVVKKGQGTVQPTSSNIEPVGSSSVPSLKIYNASTGSLIGAIVIANINKGVGIFTGTLNVSANLSSIAVQGFEKGVAIVTFAQKK